jgi:hypothetical protein
MVNDHRDLKSGNLLYSPLDQKQLGDPTKDDAVLQNRFLLNKYSTWLTEQEQLFVSNYPGIVKGSILARDVYRKQFPQDFASTDLHKKIANYLKNQNLYKHKVINSKNGQIWTGNNNFMFKGNIPQKNVSAYWSIEYCKRKEILSSFPACYRDLALDIEQKFSKKQDKEKLIPIAFTFFNKSDQKNMINYFYPVDAFSDLLSVKPHFLDRDQIDTSPSDLWYSQQPKSSFKNNEQLLFDYPNQNNYVTAESLLMIESLFTRRKQPYWFLDPKNNCLIYLSRESKVLGRVNIGTRAEIYKTIFKEFNQPLKPELKDIQ